MSFPEVPSETISEQRKIEKAVTALYANFQAHVGNAIDTAHIISPGHQVHSQQASPHEVTAADLGHLSPFKLDTHIEYLTNTTPFPKSFLSLESSSLWFVYWRLHSLCILGQFDAFLERQTGERDRIIDYLKSAQNDTGGFGGAPRWLSHLSVTYAVCAVVRMLEAYEIVNRDTLHTYLVSLKHDGGFRLHQDGEVDMRGTYCALASAAMMGILTPEITDGVAEWIQSCQRYDGGIAGLPGGESHAGYTYCGLASMCLLDKAHTHLNLNRLLRWLIHRQQPPIGGFNGRPNKLIDSCYTFWVAGCFPMLKYAFYRSAEGTPMGEMYISTLPDKGSCWMDPFPILTYLLLACQPCLAQYDEEGHKLCEKPSKCGGLCDKPGKAPDYYHTCYGLSGLAIVQEWCAADYAQATQRDGKGVHGRAVDQLVMEALPRLQSVCPIMNVIRSKVAQSSLPPGLQAWPNHQSEGYTRFNNFVDSCE